MKKNMSGKQTGYFKRTRRKNKLRKGKLNHHLNALELTSNEHMEMLTYINKQKHNVQFPET